MNKVIVFGASGFVGQTFVRILDKENCEYIAHSSKTIDLTSPDSVEKIATTTKDGDAIIMLSALTPGKDESDRIAVNNLLMIRNIISGIKDRNIARFIYISSDAVYPLTSDIIDEETIPKPMNLYGYSHLIREKFLEEYISPEKLAILRPCAIYGKNDTHNAYGIMRFIRSAQESGDISLFGGGEEYRDHIHVDDLADIIFASYKQKTTGIFNVATGKSFRFIEIAELIKSSIDKEITISFKPRAVPIFHRHVNMCKLWANFPSHKPRLIDAGIMELLER